MRNFWRDIWIRVSYRFSARHQALFIILCWGFLNFQVKRIFLIDFQLLRYVVFMIWEIRILFFHFLNRVSEAGAVSRQRWEHEKEWTAKHWPQHRITLNWSKPVISFEARSPSKRTKKWTKKDAENGYAVWIRDLFVVHELGKFHTLIAFITVAVFFSNLFRCSRYHFVTDFRARVAKHLRLKAIRSYMW